MPPTAMTGSAPSPRAPHAARRIAWGCLRFVIGLGLLAYLAKSGILDLAMLTQLFSKWPVTLAALVLIAVDVVMMSLRLSWLLEAHGMRLPLDKSLQLTLVSFFFTAFLPGSAGSALAKLFYAAKENAGRRTEIATIVIFDRALGLFSLLILSLLFVPMFAHLIWTVVALRVLVLTVAILTAGLLALFLGCLFDGSLANRLMRWFLGLFPWKGWPDRILATIGFYRGSLGTLAAGFAASVLANLSIIGVAALAVLALNPSSLSLKMCVVIPMGYIANSLPLTPGGLGVGETAFNSLFRIAGLAGGAEALLCWRIWTLPAGMLGLVYYLRGLGRSVHDAEGASTQRS